MPTQRLRQFQTLNEPVVSPSGIWALRYDADGRAVISSRDGAITWRAGAVGALRLELERDGVAAVRDGDEVVWRADLPIRRYSFLVVNDEGDGLFYDGGLLVHSLLDGPIEAVSLGDRAPVAEIRDNRFLRSADGKRTVTGLQGGPGLAYERAYDLTTVVQPAEAATLDQPDTWLTWRFHDDGGRGEWELVLVGPDDEARWILGKGHVTGIEPEPADESARAERHEQDDSSGGDGLAWMTAGLGIDEAYCVTVIHDVDADEALRRFGASDEHISTASWAELLRRATYEGADSDDRVVAAFSLGPHAMLVEDNGWSGIDLPELSRGTFAVSSFRSINADTTFCVSRDGETLATFDDNCPSLAWGADPFVLTEALAEMGIDDAEAFDADESHFLEDLELLCRVAKIRPTVADVTGRARVAILPKPVGGDVSSPEPAETQRRVTELQVGDTLRPGTILSSPSGRYIMANQPDGDVVVRAADGQTPLWSTRTRCDLPDLHNRLVLQPTGNLVVFGATGRALWSTGTQGQPVDHVTLGDDGRLVLTAIDGGELWSSTPAPDG